jgi:hypothetical protein
MRIRVKIIAFGVACFSAGAALGWAITADRADRKIRFAEGNAEIYSNLLKRRTTELAEAQTEVQSVSQQLHLRSIRDVVVEGLPNVALDEPIPEDEPDDVIPLDETEEETRAKLQAQIAQYTSNPDDRDFYVDRIPVHRVGEVDYTPPFVISRELYSWDDLEGDDYSKITLMYYPGPRVLLDDGQDPIDDVEGTIGWKSLNQFGGESGDPNTVFVRNRRLLTDYEVVRAEDDEELPVHVVYGMSHDEFEANKIAGRFREGDM